MAQSEATNIKSIPTAEMGLGGSIVDVLPRHQSSRGRGSESQNSNRHRGELTGPNSALPLITGTQGGEKTPAGHTLHKWPWSGTREMATAMNCMTMEKRGSSRFQFEVHVF